MRPVVVWPEMSSPAQSFASVIQPTSPPPSSASVLGFQPSAAPSVGTAVGLTPGRWQNSHARMRHERTSKRPVKNVMRLEQRNAYQWGSFIHNSSSLSVVGVALLSPPATAASSPPAAVRDQFDAIFWSSEPSRLASASKSATGADMTAAITVSGYVMAGKSRTAEYIRDGNRCVATVVVISSRPLRVYTVGWLTDRTASRASRASRCCRSGSAQLQQQQQRAWRRRPAGNTNISARCSLAHRQ